MDVLSPCDDDFLSRHEIEKGGMNLIDEARAVSLYDAMPERTQQSGGSAANSAYGFACLGGNAAFAGQVATDKLGEHFISDLAQANVDFVGRQEEDEAGNSPFYDFCNARYCTFHEYISRHFAAAYPPASANRFSR